VGKLVEAWNQALKADERSDVVVAKAPTGTKRKVEAATGEGGMDDAEIRQRFDEGLLSKVEFYSLRSHGSLTSCVQLRVDQLKVCSNLHDLVRIYDNNLCYCRSSSSPKVSQYPGRKQTLWIVLASTLHDMAEL
jgi:hypothetical protein